jgi:hypothetical protein
MTTDDNAKYKNAFWWITSIAISVLCCSILFVLFASYLVDLKADIRDDMIHINTIEARQAEVLTQIEMLSKRLPPPQTQTAVAPTTDAAPVETPTAPVTSTTPPEEMPSTSTTPVTPPSMPAQTTKP